MTDQESLEYRMAVSRYHGAVELYRRANMIPDAFGYGAESFRMAERELFAAKAEMERLAERDYRAGNPRHAACFQP